MKPAIVMLCVSTAGVTAAQLYPEAAVAWTAYVSGTESRIGGELESPRGFLALDFVQDAAAERRQVLGGDVVVEKMATADAQGRKMAVPSALVHHWRGDVFIPGTTVAQIVSQLQTGTSPRQEDVLQSRVLERGPDRMKVYLKLQRKKFVTVVYNTEHVVTFARRGGDARDEHQHRDEDRRAGGPGHTGGTRAAGGRRPRVLVAPQRLLALRGSGRRRDCGMRVDQPEP